MINVLNLIKDICRNYIQGQRNTSFPSERGQDKDATISMQCPTGYLSDALEQNDDIFTTRREIK